MQVTPIDGVAGTDSNTNMIEKVRGYLVYWPLILIFFLVSMAIAWTYLKFTIPLYQSSATILIKEEKGSSGALSQASFGFNTSEKIVDNEIVVLTSRTVMKEVVKKLALYAPVSAEDKFNDVPAYALSPVKVELREPEQLKQVQKVYFDFDHDKRHVIVDMQWYPLNQWITTKWGTLRFSPNIHYRPSPVKQKLYFSLIDIKDVASGLVNNLSVAAASKISTVLNLRLTDPVPARGEDILNEVIRVYTSADQKDKSTLAENALAISEDRLRYVVGDLDSVESALQQFRASEGVIDISTQGKLYLQSVEANDKQVSDLNNQLAILNQVERYVVSHSAAAPDEAGAADPGTGNGGSVRQYKTGNATVDITMAPSTLGLQDENLIQLLQKLYDTELQYARLSRTTAESSSMMISLRDQITRLRPGILENIRNQKANLQASRQNLEATSSSYTSMLSTIPEKERRLLDITRQQAIKNDVYTFLLQKREEAAMALASSVSDNRLVDSAESDQVPVSPKRSLVYAVALLLGLGLPISLVSIKDAMNQSIRSKADIIALSSLPVMGEITYNKSKNPLVIAEGERSYVAEQFRQVRTALSFAGIHDARNKLLVTSSVTGEGKTFIASNLAISLALTDKKVVLLELDLRKPQLSGIFNTSGKPGMSEYLAGKAGMGQIISRTAVHENMYLVPAGAVPVNPSELILNGRLGELITHLEKTFDYIIMETAPVSVVTDAYVVAEYCDATLFIIRYGHTRKEDIRRVEESISMKGLQNASVIFNAVRTQQVNKNAYYYYEAKENKSGTRKQSGQII